MDNLNSISDVINYLKNNLDKTDITLNKGASENQIKALEDTYAIKLPDDFRQFYEFTDGFLSDEDQFRMIDLHEIKINKDYKNELYFAEYLCFCDMWGLETSSDNYNVLYGKMVLGHSLTDFLKRFLKGGVFEAGGLYDWRDEINKLNS